MRKFTKISAALAAMVLVLSFAGCSDGGSSNGDENVGSSSSGSGSGSGSSSGGSSSSGSGSSSSGDSSGSQSGSESGAGSSSGGSSSSGSGSSSGSSSSTGSSSGGSSSSGSGSSSSESDDDWKTILPSSQGENPLSGNSYSYEKNDGSKKISIVFTEDTAVETEIKVRSSGKSESSISEYKYTYNADKGLLYLKVVSWTVDGEKITSSEELFEFAAREFGMTVEEARELLADDNFFEGYETRNCFKKDESTVVFGDYFDGEDGEIPHGEFNYYVSGGSIELDDGITVENYATGEEYEYWDGEFASDKKTFIFSNEENVQVSGSWSTVENASKTLKELYEETKSYSDKEAESNGYIIVKFSKLSSEMQASPFNMDTNSSYKFIFDTNPDVFTKTN